MHHITFIYILGATLHGKAFTYIVWQNIEAINNALFTYPYIYLVILAQFRKKKPFNFQLCNLFLFDQWCHAWENVFLNKIEVKHVTEGHPIWIKFCTYIRPVVRKWHLAIQIKYLVMDKVS